MTSKYTVTPDDIRRIQILYKDNFGITIGDTAAFNKLSLLLSQVDSLSTSQFYENEKNRDSDSTAADS